MGKDHIIKPNPPKKKENGRILLEYLLKYVNNELKIRFKPKHIFNAIWLRDNQCMLVTGTAVSFVELTAVELAEPRLTVQEVVEVLEYFENELGILIPTCNKSDDVRIFSLRFFYQNTVENLKDYDEKFRICWGNNQDIKEVFAHPLKEKDRPKFSTVRIPKLGDQKRNDTKSPEYIKEKSLACCIRHIQFKRRNHEKEINSLLKKLKQKDNELTAYQQNTNAALKKVEDYEYMLNMRQETIERVSDRLDEVKMEKYFLTLYAIFTSAALIFCLPFVHMQIYG